MSFGFGVGDFIAVLDKAKLYRERFADAPDQFDSLSREIASLTSILEYIGHVEDQLTEDEKEALAPSIKESTKLLGELEKIFNENASLEKHEGTSKLTSLKPRAVWRRLRIKPEDIQKLRQRITLNVHFLTAIKGFRDSEAIHSTKQVVTLMHDEQTSRQEREILDWLTTTDYAPQQRDHLSRRYTGTNQWLLDCDKYKSWISGKSQTLLCPGMPGAGKTIMVSVVVDDLFHRYRNDSSVGIAYVYCNLEDQERQNYYDILSSITKQLAQCRSPIPDSLKALYDTHHRKKTSRTLEDTINVLQAVASSHDRVFIVVDALDECESKSRQALLSEVFRLQKRHPTNVLATTREIPEIIESANFKNANTLKIQASDVDVSRYISSRTPDMQSFVQRRPEIQEEIQKGILCRINGMFLLAKLLIDSLSYKTTPKAVRKALVAASNEDNTYAYFYDEALERIRVQPPARVQLANQVLSWIVFAKRPLEMNELQHALAVEDDEPEIEEDNIPSSEIIISSCAGLVTLDEQGGIVRLVHQTTQEFFNKRKSYLFPEADAEITNTCVRYLGLDQVQRLIRNHTRCIPSWRKPYHFESFAFKDLRKSKFPFCEYAVLYWGHHAENCDTLQENAVHLLKSREMLQSLAIISRDLTGEDVPSAGAHLAASFGLLQVFKDRLLPADEISFVDREEQSILSWAAHRGHVKLIAHILEEDTLQLKRRHDRGRIEPFHLALFKAVELSHLDAVGRLLHFASVEDIDFESANGPSLLYLCIGQRDVTMIRLLLERSRHLLSSFQKPTSAKGVKLEKMDSYHGTPLAFAACKGLDEAVQLFLDHGANIEALDSTGRNALSRAVQSGHVSTVKVLLQNGAKFLSQPDKPTTLWPLENQDLMVELLINGGANIESRNERGMTVLASAAEAGQLSILVILLDKKANIEARDNEGWTPLWHALVKKQDSSFEVLLKRGAAVEAVDRHGDTPLHFAAKNCLISMLAMLLESGAQVDARNTKTGQTPLWHAISHEQTLALETLIHHKASIEAKGCTGRTPLSFAAGTSNLPALETLLRHGAVVDTSDEHHRTPLCYAAMAGSSSCLIALKEKGAEISCRDVNNMTPIMLAAESRRLSMLGNLSELGNDVAVRDKFGRTALLIVAGADRDSVSSTDNFKSNRGQGNEENSEIDSPAYDDISCIFSGCRHLVEAPDNHGRTPLWWATATRKISLMDKLSEIVDEVEVLDKLGKPPLMLALDGEYSVIQTIHRLLNHVSQFSPGGKRLRSRKRVNITERAIGYVRYFLEFNGIDPDTTIMFGLRVFWRRAKPGKPLFNSSR